MIITSKAYSPKALAAIQQAYDAVWAALDAKQRPREAVKDLRITLSQTLVALAANGVTEPNELQRQALEAPAPRPNREQGTCLAIPTSAA